MRYCPRCDAEFRDAVTSCTDDGTALLDRAAYDAELARQGRRPLDVRRLATVATFADRFQAEEIAEELVDDGFHAALVTTKAPTVGPLTDPAPTEWSIVVPEVELERATVLVAEWRDALDASTGEAEKAAEAEEAATEKQP